jgi:putative nucleotidyltransferase with HDIG domain
MARFANYLHPEFTLEERMGRAFDDLGVDNFQRKGIFGLMHPLKIKDEATYEHSIRVGLLTRAIASFMHLDQKVMLYPGLLHDVGKVETRTETLKKTEGWTPADAKEIKRHVLDGYRLVRGHFNFTAEIIKWHQFFQKNAYPKKIPEPLHKYSEGTKTMLRFYGRLLALADQFDAVHRINNKFGGAHTLNGEEMKENLLEENPDQTHLIRELYNNGIFTTYLVSEDPDASVSAD